jgi:hypothetical protein
MRVRRSAVVALASLASLACAVAVAGCGGGDAPPPSLGDTTGGTSAGQRDGSAIQPAGGSKDASTDGRAADAPAEGHADGGDGGDAAFAGEDAAVDAAAIVSPGTDAAMAQPSCDPTATWSAPALVGGVSFPMQAIVTMTSDERTVAWVIDAGQGRGRVFTADRATGDGAFGRATELTAGGSGSSGGGGPDAAAGTAYFAFDRVGLSADGLTLVGVATDGLGMAGFTRTGRDQPFFALAQPSAYAALVRPLMPGEVLGDPVLSADGDDIVYSRYGQSHTVSIFEAFRAGSVPWGGGSPRQSQPLEMSAGLRKLPTSLSADRLTLFVWDEATSAAYGVFRSDPMGDFTGAQPYGPRYSLQVNGACTRLYYVGPDGAGFALYRVTSM